MNETDDEAGRLAYEAELLTFGAQPLLAEPAKTRRVLWVHGLDGPTETIHSERCKFGEDGEWTMFTAGESPLSVGPPAAEGLPALPEPVVRKCCAIFDGSADSNVDVYTADQMLAYAAEAIAADRAVRQPPLREVGLTRDVHGMCIVTVNGREAIRDNGDVISHYATPDWFATLGAKP